MKILLSAYACEPHKGSEPGVGWNWARTLALQGHDVHLITRSNNRETLARAIEREGLPLRTAYTDLPGWCRRWKRLPGGIHLYYLLWQLAAYRVAARLHRERGFDCVHHVTFASFRQPSWMGALGIPFVFGPVGGGESTPPTLLRGLTGKQRLLEWLRSRANSTARIDPMMAFTYRRAQLIACTTGETRARIPRRFQAKCVVQPTIGIEAGKLSTPAHAPEQPTFLYVGRLLYWKGLHLALAALAEVHRQLPGVRLRVIGDGEDGSWLKERAVRAGVAELVDWIPWMPHEEIMREYGTASAFVFPSLHDSGGMVVLEALAAGLPVICLDLGGPASLVDETCGVVVPTGNREQKAVVAGLSAAMLDVVADPQRRSTLAAGCHPRAEALSWDAGARRLYSQLSPSRLPRQESSAVAAGSPSAKG